MASDSPPAPAVAAVETTGPSIEDVDAETLERFTVNATRALEEPPICHPEHEPRVGSRLYQAVPTARITQLKVVPGDERVSMATWPEVAYFYMTASGSNEAWVGGDDTDFYQYAFELAVRRYFQADLADVLDELGRAPVSLADHQRRTLGRFRRELKKRRDRVFLEERYDDVDPRVPKAAWKADGVAGHVEDVPAAPAGEAPLVPRAEALTR